MLMRTLIEQILGMILARTLYSNLAILKTDNNVFNNYRRAMYER